MLSEIKETLSNLLRDAGAALSLFDLVERTGASADALQTALSHLCEMGAASSPKRVGMHPPACSG